MLCSTCGEKILFEKDMFICKACDSESDMLDFIDNYISEPIFVMVELKSSFGIIDTRSQTLYAKVDTIVKANLIADLLNKHCSQMEMIKQTNRYIGH
jgi:hypothetical protein